MNIHGHKKKAKTARAKKDFWEMKIQKLGAFALRRFNLWLSVYKWHKKQISILKKIKTEGKAKA